MTTIYINGKFLAQPLTGVQRYARQLLLAVDRHLQEHPGADRWVLLRPAGAAAPFLQRVHSREVGPAGLQLHLWEQLVLPWAARGALLLSLAGSSPVAARRQMCTLHDAAVFDAPHGYTWAFVAWYRMLFRLQARRALRLLTVSEFSRSRLATQLHLQPVRVGVVPDGADHLDEVSPDDAILARLALHGTRFVLAVASANPNKNIQALKAAFSRAATAPDLRLVLVGSANPAVFAARQEAPTDPRIVHAGTVSDAELVALYRQAAGLVFPSLYEGFGLPPLEAMAQGCPVAAARAGAVPEVCGDAAIYFDPHVQPAIEAAIKRLLEAGPAVQALRAAGPVQARRWTWARSAAALVQQTEALR
jgi:glycosyltransferase involved in cell wall biosynthesis